MDRQLRLQTRDRLARLLAVGLYPLDGRRQLVWQHRERANTTGDGIAVPAQGTQHPATAISPISPVRATWVPPQADRSKSATSINRNGPSRTGSLRSGRRAASSGDANLIATGRSSHTTRLASSTHRSTSTNDASRARSIVAVSLPM